MCTILIFVYEDFMKKINSFEDSQPAQIDSDLWYTSYGPIDRPTSEPIYISLQQIGADTIY